jgi:hypothetical protein
MAGDAVDSDVHLFYPDVEVRGDLGGHDTLPSIKMTSRLLGYRSAYGLGDADMSNHIVINTAISSATGGIDGGQRFVAGPSISVRLPARRRYAASPQ